MGETTGRNVADEFRFGVVAVVTGVGRRVGFARTGVLGFRVVFAPTAVPLCAGRLVVGRVLYVGRAVGRGLCVTGFLVVGIVVVVVLRSDVDNGATSGIESRTMSDVGAKLTLAVVGIAIDGMLVAFVAILGRAVGRFVVTLLIGLFVGRRVVRRLVTGGL